MTDTEPVEPALTTESVKRSFLGGHLFTSMEGKHDKARQFDAWLESLLPPCDGGCVDGPEETCSRHGRPVAEVWRMQQDALTRVHELEAEVAALRTGGSVPPPITVPTRLGSANG